MYSNYVYLLYVSGIFLGVSFFFPPLVFWSTLFNLCQFPDDIIMEVTEIKQSKDSGRVWTLGPSAGNETLMMVNDD